jgi:fermentation-respiration switch protein FrsA (DUF1100 family)
MRPGVRFVLMAMLALIVGVVGLAVFQRRLIYFPSPTLPDVDTVLPGAEEVSFETEDGLTLDGWFVPSSSNTTDVTVVVFNGNAGNRGDRVRLAMSLSARGYAVMLFDYRGFGTNPGNPSEEGLLADGRAVVRYLENRSGVDPDRLVYLGESLGAAVAVATAEHRPPAVLVLRSPFTSLPDVASVHYPFLPASLLLWDEYPNVQTIRRVVAPLLVIAGSADRTVPVQQSEDVYLAGAEPKRLVIIEGADHNDARLNSGVQFVDAVVAFIDDVMQRGSG